MAKKKKKAGQHYTPQPVQKPEASWPWVVLAGVVLALVLGMVLFALFGGMEPEQTDDPTQGSTDIPGVTAPLVDDSKTTTMRIVKPGSAYVEKNTSAGTVFSFRKGDRVEVVENDGRWVTIAVEGRGYYLPSEMVRGVDEYLIVIDAGHQMYEDHGKEAIGPGGAETEIKMDVGGVGVYTKQNEYDVNLAVCLKLKETLESRGYKVELIRNHNAINMSYVERTQVANSRYADAYISLHAPSAEDAERRGVSAVCQSAKNSYNASMYSENKELCTVIVDALSKATGAKKLDVQETDKKSGINWCQVPVAYVEMGYLSNENEDRLLSSETYQQKIADGIANGLDQFFAEEEKS